jgi:RNA polymerase sigma-70 factor (ECF subfamily)
MTSQGKFHTTRWTVIRSARAKDEPGSAEALASLCEAYWYPLYVFVRRMGHSADDARDLTQGYFLRLLEKDYLEGVNPEAGKFRSFLLASLKHYLANVRREASALKRGGGKPLVSLDLDAAENRYRNERYRNEPIDDETPDKAYERRWALAVIDRARGRLKQEFVAADKLRQFKLLAGHLTGSGDAQPYRDIAEELGTTEAAVKMTVSRMRRQYGRALRDEIADTIDDPTAVDAEVRHLLSNL